MTKPLESSLRRTALTFAGRVNDVAEQYVARSDVLRIVALATLCQEHALIIGPPGTAKTALLERFSRMLGARYFAYLLTRFTEPAELFGPIDVASFQQSSVYRVNTEGMLPKAEIAFLDEIFHGSSAILNSLLTLVNERTFHNGADVERANLITLLGAANDLPDDPTMLAFCDRFLFRFRLDYVADESIVDLLSIGWESEQEAIREGIRSESAAIGADVDLADLRQLQAAVADVDVAHIRDDLAKILRSFREEAITFSDRRTVKAQKAIAASAVLGGRARAEVEDLAVLVHLWTEPHDEASIRRVVETHGVPLAASARTSRSLEELTYFATELRREADHVGSREECREVLRRLGRLLAEVRSSFPDAADLLREIGRSQSHVLTILRDRFREDGDFDV